MRNSYHVMALLTLLCATTAHAAEMREYVSQNGILSMNLVAAEQQVRIGDDRFVGKTYNKDYAGPVLRAAPGDTLRLRLYNHMAEPTNLHFHGLHTSPLGSGDNMHAVVEPGHAFTYEVIIPKDQPPSLYWFHADAHAKGDEQVRSGLSGTLVVEGLEKQLPQLAGLTQKIFVLKDHEIEKNEAAETPDKIIRSINGKPLEKLAMQRGELQLWRFANHSPEFMYILTLQDHKFRIVARDGAAVNQEIVTDKLEIVPAGRVEVLVDAGDAGRYDLVAEQTQSVPDGNIVPVHTLAHLSVAHAAKPNAAAVTQFPANQD